MVQQAYNASAWRTTPEFSSWILDRYSIEKEDASMKRMVVDKNYLESEDLRAYLAESRDNFAVVTDYAQLEMLKGNALVNILKSTEILAQYPKQVLILKPIDVISGMKGKKKGRKKRFTSGRATRSFRKWCRKRTRAKAGEKRLQQQIIDAGKEAAAQLADMLENAQTFAENIDEATKRFTKEELEILRQHKPLPPDIVVKILEGTMDLAKQFFALHSDIGQLPSSEELPHTFIFRFSLCAYLHALRWAVAGGAKDARLERIRNDIIDVTFAAYATCFDGLLSKDDMANELYENADFLLKNAYGPGKK